MHKRNYYLFGSAFVIFLVALLLYRTSLKRMNEFVGRVNHTQQVIVSFEKLSANIKSAQLLPSEPGRRHYNALLALYEKEIQNIPGDILRLRKLVKDNPDQQIRIDTLYQIVARQKKFRLSQRTAEPLTEENSGKFFANILGIQRVIDRAIQLENSLLEERQVIFNTTLRRMKALTVVSFTVSIFLIVGISITNVYQVKKRKKAELFLQSILNTTQNGIMTFEAVRFNNEVVDFRTTFANDTIEMKISMKCSEVIGKPLNSIFPDTNQRVVFKKFLSVLETGQKDDLEYYYKVNNLKRCFFMRLAKLNDGINLLFADITPLKEYEQELHTKVGLLQTTNKELEQFAFVASHDLNEPLRKIITYAGILLKRDVETAPEFITNYLTKISLAAGRMSNLVNDLLNLSDLTTNKTPLCPTDLNLVLRNVLVDFELIIEEKGAVINCDLLQEIEEIPLQMNQLFYNLISNSLKFTKPVHAPELHIFTLPVTAHELTEYHLDRRLEYIKIAFKDNGIGFDTDFSEKIFDMFQRLNTRHQYAGSGIGLALCRKIVMLHHGYIYSESSSDNGATFYIILPLKQPVTIPGVFSPSLSFAQK